MLLTRLIGTTSFRLAATYLAMFCASIAELGGVVYFAVGGEIVQQIDQRIVQETDRFLSEFGSSGLGAWRSIFAPAKSRAMSSSTAWKTAGVGF